MTNAKLAVADLHKFMLGFDAAGIQFTFAFVALLLHTPTKVRPGQTSPVAPCAHSALHS